MTLMRIRDVDLNVEVVGNGPPLVLMDGGPGGDLYTLLSFRQCKDQFTLVFYDHRCNGRPGSTERVPSGSGSERQAQRRLKFDEIEEMLAAYLAVSRTTAIGHVTRRGLPYRRHDD